MYSKKLIFDQRTKTSIALDSNSSYTFYVVKGQGSTDNSRINQDDAIRVSHSSQLEIDFIGELFFVQTATQLDYKTVW